MRTGSGKAGKNEQVTLEIEEPERLCGGAEGVSARGGARSARRSTGNPRHVETLHNGLSQTQKIYSSLMKETYFIFWALYGCGIRRHYADFL